ncbi:hypothetical protein C2W63_00384 [Bacillus velezensis]|nr:hypothetical protein C2W63_00384 [Bacillus velezensis]
MLTLTKWFFFILASSFSHINHFYFFFRKLYPFTFSYKKKTLPRKSGNVFCVILRISKRG